MPLCVEPFLMVWQEPHLGQRNIEACESLQLRLDKQESYATTIGSLPSVLVTAIACTFENGDKTGIIGTIQT